MEAGTFALVPIEVVKDRRLTLEQTRVLVALFSFRNKSTDTVWPSRAAISDRTGMHVANISTATTALSGLGWLRKDGVGGHSKATRYTITVPDLGTVADSTTVAERATVADSATTTVAHSATPPVAEWARGKEHTNEHTSEQNKKPRAFAALDYLLATGVSESVASDWLALRKQKKATVTETAVKRIEREAHKAGLSLNAALETCCARGWQGFEAAWIAPKPAAQSRDDARQQWLDELTGRNRHDAIDAPARLVG